MRKPVVDNDEVGEPHDSPDDSELEGDETTLSLEYVVDLTADEKQLVTLCSDPVFFRNVPLIDPMVKT